MTHSVCSFSIPERYVSNALTVKSTLDGVACVNSLRTETFANTLFIQMILVVQKRCVFNRLFKVVRLSIAFNH